VGRGATSALTPEEILKLKAAGVSEKTIQLLLQQDQEKKIPPSLVEQGYATDNIGTSHLKDGRTITSTGKRQLPLHYPTEYPPISPYGPQIYPYIAAPPVERWRGAPVSESPPALGATTTPPSTPAPASPYN
jgi:hypothetical protein